ncbi:uncharacterized protein LOC135205858 [Macrobrachium nipponense]|uniref:uncharacterized protein LOC135205858 n=1 Tax=Macrobrachium nipponense TaxID=159736 RepID=UPI0030C7E0A1
MLERIVEGRLRELIDINEQQFGFMKGKSTVDAIFIVRQVQEKYLEGDRRVYMCFEDLEKAYDRVPRNVVYWCLRKRGVPEELVKLVKMMYEGGGGAKTTVQTHMGRLGLASIRDQLESILVPRHYRHFDIRINEQLAFADLTITADTEEELRERFLPWKGALERRGLKVNIGRTELMISSKEGHEEVNIQVEDGAVLKQNKEFNNLGSIITEEGGTEGARRLAKMERSNWSCFKQGNAIRAQNEDS